LAPCPPKVSYMVKYQTPEKIKLKFDTINEGRLFWLGRSVVDIGCNEGLLYPLLKECGISSYIGIDNSVEYIDKAKENFPEASFVLHDLRVLSEVLKHADIGIALSTLHIFDDDEYSSIIESLSKIFRVLIMEAPVVGNSPIYYTRTEEQIITIGNRFFDYTWEYGISPSPHDTTSIRKAFKMEKYYDKIVNIEELYTDNFGERKRLIDCGIVECAAEVLGGSTPSRYRRFVEELYHGMGHLFGRTDENAVDDRVDEFYKLVRSMSEGINKEKAGHLLSHNRLYGDMLCQDTAEGFLVVDGHHRLSTLYAMGIKLAGIKTCI
jgi:SAM-dependent methyltransferase